MICLLDMDGVIVDFVGAACYEHFARNPYDDLNNRGEWNLPKLLGITAEAFWEPLNESWWWESLDMTPDGWEIFFSVLEHFDAEEIVFCSTPTLNPDSAKGKIMWIERNFPDWRRRFIITPRKDILAHKGTLLIDDNDKNVDQFRDAGGDAILVPRPWNRLHRGSENAVESVEICLKRERGR